MVYRINTNVKNTYDVIPNGEHLRSAPEDVLSELGIRRSARIRSGHGQVFRG